MITCAINPPIARRNARRKKWLEARIMPRHECSELRRGATCCGTWRCPWRRHDTSAALVCTSEPDGMASRTAWRSNVKHNGRAALARRCRMLHATCCNAVWCSFCSRSKLRSRPKSFSQIPSQPFAPSAMRAYVAPSHARTHTPPRASQDRTAHTHARACTQPHLHATARVRSHTRRPVE